MSNRHLSAIHPFFCGSCYKKAKLPLSPQMRGNIIREEDRTPVLEQVGHGAVLPHFQYALSFLFLVFLRIALFGQKRQTKNRLLYCYSYSINFSMICAIPYPIPEKNSNPSVADIFSFFLPEKNQTHHINNDQANI